MPRKAWKCEHCGDRGNKASMRPRLLCPGKRWRLDRLGDGRLGFNEAEAVMPRKAVFPRSPPRSPPRFNEAEAVMPRKAWMKFRSFSVLRLLQ